MFERVRTWMGRRTVYEGPLSELVGASLRNDGVEALQRRAAGEDADIRVEDSAIPYIERVLEEEVEKQFSDAKRPFIELVANAIDARPEGYDGTYEVSVRPWRSSFTVHDDGASMGLEDLLQTFMVPFNSEKDAYEDIGRFGVGFFSNLNHCLDDGGEVIVKANDGDQAYTTRFWSESGDVEDLQVRIREGGRSSRGTTVKIKDIDVDMAEVSEYVEDYFEYFDPERAVIKEWWRQVNEEPAGETYRDEVPLSVEGTPVRQPIRMTIDPLADEEEATAKLYSQGILIRDEDLDRGAFHVSLPAAVRIVEGRNEFKRDETYESVVDGIYGLLLDYVEDMDDPGTREALVGMVPAVADSLQREPDPETVDALSDAVFPAGTYVLGTRDVPGQGPLNEYEQASRFFGEDVEEDVTGLDSYEATTFWSDLPGLEQMVADRTEYVAAGDRDAVTGELPDSGAGVAAEILPEQLPYDREYRAVSVEGGAGPSPFLPTADALYVNVDHPLLQEDSFAAEYGVKTGYMQADGVNEYDIERMVER